MASKIVYTDCKVTLAGSNLTDWVKSVTVQSQKDAVDATTHGQNTKAHMAGLGETQISLTLKQDFDAAALDAILWPIFDGRVPENLIVTPFSTLPSADNPAYAATVYLQNYPALTASVGEIAETSIDFVQASNVLGL